MAALTTGLGGCAHTLTPEKDLHQAPSEMQAKIEQLEPQPERSAAGLTSPPSALHPQTPAQAAAMVAAGPQPSPKAKPARASKSTHGLVPATPQPLAPPPAPAAWQPSHWPYGVGEKITWALRYGLIEGGVASLSVEEPQMLDGEPVIHYRGTVRSSRLLELFYKVDDEIQSWVRLKDHVPLRQEIRQIESARWGRRVVTFDPQTSIAKYFTSFTKAKGGSEEIKREDPVTPWAQDIFGALYFYRFADNLQRMNFPIHDRWKNWNNEMTYLGEEQLHLPSGDYDTLHFKMLPRVTGMLEPKGDVEIWLWKHPSNVIVRFRAKIKVGSITGDLRSYEAGSPLKFPVPVMKTPINLTALGEAPKPASQP